MSQQDEVALDFPYTLRHSARAKRLSINLTQEKGVELVCPKRVSEKKARQFLYTQRAWVLKHRAQWESVVQPVTLPARIELLAMQQSWQVQYETKLLHTKRSRLLQRPDQSLVYWGAPESSIIFPLLSKWCQRQAKEYLAKRLRAWSCYADLPYARLSFRKQRTRWGSCSSEHHISLNTKLVFMPEVAVDYVLLHELAHTKHLNHSKRFWALVARWMPDYKQHQALLKQHQTKVPVWY